GLRVVYIPVRRAAAAAHDLIFTLVQRGEKGDRDGAGALAFAHELRLLVAEGVEEGKPDGLDNRGLAGAVVAADGSRGSSLVEGGVAIALDVLEFDPDNVHGWLSLSGLHPQAGKAAP